MNSLFRFVGIAEGLSFLLLLGIAMPLKYVWGHPQAVQIVGMAHGVLFIAYVLLATKVAYDKRWPLKILVLAYLASVLPFGTFVFQSKYGEHHA
jgi:integral membrane protein